MRERPTPAALLRAYKACLTKLDAQMRELLATATAAELEEHIWLHDEFTLPRGMRVGVSMSFRAELPAPRRSHEPLRIEGPKREGRHG